MVQNLANSRLRLANLPSPYCKLQVILINVKFIKKYNSVFKLFKQKGNFAQDIVRCLTWHHNISYS